MNKQTKKIVIILAGILVLAGIILLVFFHLKGNTNKLENDFKSMAVKFYEAKIEPHVGKTLTQVGYYIVTLDELKNNQYDISEFEKKSCDMGSSYVTFTYNEEDSYDLEVTLNCEK